MYDVRINGRTYARFIHLTDAQAFVVVKRASEPSATIEIVEIKQRRCSLS
jgi:hypothetical protein